MKNKENIYNNLGQININDAKEVDRMKGYANVITSSCIICGNPIDSFGNKFICNDCKEALELVVRSIRAAKQQKENTLKKQQITCPRCGSSNIEYTHGIMLLYDYLDLEENYNKDNHCLTKHFICRDCLNEFDISVNDKKK